MTEWAIVAVAPMGTTMVVSCHPTEESADQERIALTRRKPMWSFHTEVVVPED